MAEPRRSLFLLAASFALVLAGCAAPAPQQSGPVAPAAPAAPAVVGGATMDPAASILDNLGKSADHSTLVGLVRAAGLAERLSGAEQVTLIAPTNEAFARLPQGTLETLSAAENRGLLAQILNYHLISGARTRANLAATGAGVRTLHGGWLKPGTEGPGMTLTDFHGNSAAVTVPDVRSSNGVFHVVDRVLLPSI